MTITEFLLARIAEDEAVARDATALAEVPWRATYGRQVETAHDGYLVTPEDEHSRSDDPTDAVSEHIARHDPARVLAECEAKREIVRVYLSNPMSWQSEVAVRALAAVHADHPDYDESWRP